MGIEADYEGKVVLVTGGAKLFFYKVLKPLLKKQEEERSAVQR
jgi:hypothetical protein